MWLKKPDFTINSQQTIIPHAAVEPQTRFIVTLLQKMYKNVWRLDHSLTMDIQNREIWTVEQVNGRSLISSEETLEGLLRRSAGSLKTAAYHKAVIVERTRTVLVKSGNSIPKSVWLPCLYFFQDMEDNLADRDPLPERGAVNSPWVPIRSDGEEDCATVLAVMRWKLCSIAVWKQAYFWWDEKKGTVLGFKWDKKDIYIWAKIW